MQETLLQLKNATVQYGGVRALDDASVQIDEGEIVASHFGKLTTCGMVHTYV